MANFVLIHGAYQGGWIWLPVATKLRAAGHTVYAPSLDGCGERKGALRAGITTESHAAEIAELLFYEDVRDAVLVGTSTGGMVLCRAAEQVRERVGRIVFADALALLDGERLPDIVQRPTAVTTELATGPSREDMVTRMFADLEPSLRQWDCGALRAAPDRADDGAGAAGELLGPVVVRDCDPLPARKKPARGASAAHRRTSRRRLS